MQNIDRKEHLSGLIRGKTGRTSIGGAVRPPPKCALQEAVLPSAIIRSVDLSPWGTGR